jgi:ATP-dependent DNA helicase RecQ
MPAATVSADLTHALQTVFGFDHFRAHQREAVETALSGRDVLVVMPTGAGKSLCFQLPAAISEGVTLVISPLVALMRDQVMALRERTAIHQLGCAYLNSLQGTDEQRQVLDDLRDGHIKLLYVAPERFRSTGFREALSQVPLARFVVDEAHCISEWGHDFRPDYLGLRGIVESLGNPPLMAVTATATRRVQESIVANLGMRSPDVLVGGFNRPNLHLSVHRCKNEAERDARLERALPKLCANGGSGLIYVSTRKQCEQVAALAARALAPHGRRADGYHAGMDPGWRNELQAARLAQRVASCLDQ